jgi:hypothetical protein
VTGPRSDGPGAKAAPRARRAGTSALALAVAVAVAVAGCGVPEDARFREVPSDDVPFGLSERPTTTPAGLGPPPATPEALPGELVVEPVLLYFAVEGRLVGTAREVLAPPTEAQVVAALLAGPLPSEGDGPTLRSIIGPDDVGAVTTSAGVATVELRARFGELPVQEQRLAIGQLVLTLTSRPGVGQVAFTQAGEPVVRLPRADGSLVLGPLSRDDYVALIR